MVDGRVRHDWQRTAEVMATIINCHRDPKKGRAVKGSDLVRFADEAEKPLPGTIHDLKRLVQGAKP